MEHSKVKRQTLKSDETATDWFTVNVLIFHILHVRLTCLHFQLRHSHSLFNSWEPQSFCPPLLFPPLS